MRKIGMLYRLGGFALAVLLAACGGPGDETQDPLASFRQQKLSWQACDPSVGTVDAPYFAQLGGRIQCATMRAPLDYANPGLGELVVALLKVNAELPGQRKGTILFNPGGPGGDRLGMAAKFGALWTGANPQSVQGRSLKQLSNDYDLVSFSPRGVGASTQLYCGSNEFLRLENNKTVDRSPENILNILYNARLAAQTCRKNPLAKYINTDQTARDMDLIRELAGDAKLNYIGYSYGTWLGAWYASLFPERVGRMLFDSSMNFAGTFDDAGLLTEMGHQRVMDERLAPYAARHPAVFNLGTTALEVRQALQSLPVKLKVLMIKNLSINNSDDARNAMLKLNGANGLKKLLAANPQATLNDIHVAIDAQVFTPGPADNANVRTFAHGLANIYFDRTVPQQQSIEVRPDAAVNMVVKCNDTASRMDEQYWIDIGNLNAVRYPVMGGEATSQPCLYWGGPVVVKPPLSMAARAGGILMLQSRYDGITPVEGALAAFDKLPNASMIMIENEYTHALFPYGDTCVDPLVGDYFATGKMPARISSCAGRPLAGETTAIAQSAVEASKSEPAVYNDAARAAEIIRGIHQGMREASGHP